jgi:hypothetical protein
LVAATLLYCYSVIRHLEQQPRKWVNSLPLSLSL